MRKLTFLALVICLVVPFMGTAQAGSSVLPTDDNVVLESLPAGPRPVGRVNANASLASALASARTQLEAAHRLGDPRYLGYAEAQLEPWLRLPEPPIDVLLLRARLLQANHRFEPALADLNTVLKREPHQAEAQLLGASIELVRGHYHEARQFCDGVRGLTSLPLMLICRAQVDGVTGQAKQALVNLQKLPRSGLGLTPGQSAWLDLGLADIADRLGDNAIAETAYKRALANGAEAVGAYADWLHAQGRDAESLKLLQPWTTHDGLFMRLARAELALNKPNFAIHRTQLLERLAAFRQRGEVGHEREQAMLYLTVLKQAEPALVLARSNWQNQRESADFRIYAQSALAAHAVADLQVLRDWQAKTGFEDRRAVVWLQP